jgi:type IV secretory pathway VirB2 component (pilin)
MTPKITINTGTPRSVTGNLVSGALAAGMVATALAYTKYKQGELGKEEAIKQSLKLSLQGGIATGSAIAAANALGRSSWLGVLGSLTVGVAGIYGVEKLYGKAYAKETEEEVK